DELIVPNLAETYDLDEVLADERKRGMLRDAMKHKAEEAKIQLSYKDDYHLLSQLGEFPLVDATGEEVELDLSLTSAQLEAAVAPIFQRAIDIAKSLLERNQLKGGDVSSLILVGGPTHSPILRQMLEEQIAKPDTRIDPMTAVAVGAALYASTIQVSEEVREATRDLAKVQLDLGYEATSVQPMEFVSVKLHENGQAPVGL
ncbi:MAG: Hsp70 family protein, partial [Flavobacteriales bacterium]|nr:Hsp70 family protein [Flavobacteriales bacterium]